MHIFCASIEDEKRHKIERDKYYFWDLNFRHILGSGYDTFDEAARDFKAYYNQNFHCPDGRCEE